MNNAIERIKGYCCEVTQEQWGELVRVADEVGVSVYDRSWSFNTSSYVHLNVRNFIVKTGHTYTGRTVIPFTDFLAKLRGVEEWQPKAGEMVEVGGGYVREYIAERGGKHFCWGGDGESVSSWTSVKQLSPTITRAEAEQIIGKRIID